MTFTRSTTGRWPGTLSINLFDKHYKEQNELVDAIAERIQTLGGISLAMAPDVAETTMIPRPPRGREEVPVQISRLLHAQRNDFAGGSYNGWTDPKNGDDGTTTSWSATKF